MYQAIITLAYKITVSLPLKFTLGYMSSIHVARDQRPIAVTANSWTLPNATNSDISAYVLTSSSRCTSVSLCLLNSLSCADLVLLGYSSFKGSVFVRSTCIGSSELAITGLIISSLISGDLWAVILGRAPMPHDLKAAILTCDLQQAIYREFCCCGELGCDLGLVIL